MAEAVLFRMMAYEPKSGGPRFFNKTQWCHVEMPAEDYACLLDREWPVKAASSHLLFDKIVHEYGINVSGLEIGRDECICERGKITNGGTINDVVYEVWE